MNKKTLTAAHVLAIIVAFHPSYAGAKMAPSSDIKAHSNAGVKSENLIKTSKSVRMFYIPSSLNFGKFESKRKKSLLKYIDDRAATSATCSAAACKVDWTLARDCIFVPKLQKNCVSAFKKGLEESLKSSNKVSPTLQTLLKTQQEQDKKIDINVDIENYVALTLKMAEARLSAGDMSVLKDADGNIHIEPATKSSSLEKQQIAQQKIETFLVAKNTLQTYLRGGRLVVPGSGNMPASFSAHPSTDDKDNEFGSKIPSGSENSRSLGYYNEEEHVIHGVGVDRSDESHPTPRPLPHPAASIVSGAMPADSAAPAVVTPALSDPEREPQPSINLLGDDDRSNENNNDVSLDHANKTKDGELMIIRSHAPTGDEVSAAHTASVTIPDASSTAAALASAPDAPYRTITVPVPAPAGSASALKRQSYSLVEAVKEMQERMKVSNPNISDLAIMQMLDAHKDYNSQYFYDRLTPESLATLKQIINQQNTK